MSSTVVPFVATATVPRTPYLGLTPYTEQDAAFFFGREVWSEIITDNLKAYPLTLLYGESGVGKSSLLGAGVAHNLREAAQRSFVEGDKPEAAVAVFSAWRGDPVAGLAACLRAAVPGASHGPVGREEPEPTELEQALKDCSRSVHGRICVILDQFEEYFLYHQAPGADDDFAAVLPRLVARRDLRVSFLLAIREDALAKLDRFKGRIPNLFDNYLRVEHLDNASARAAIEHPLQRYNDLQPDRPPIEIEPELVDAVLDEVEAGKLQVGGARGAAVLASNQRARVEAPYLQLVMTRLWDEEIRRGSRVLRRQTLEDLGGAEGIVGTHLDAAMEALPADERDIAARAFRYLVTRSRTKVAHRLSDLADWTDVPPRELEIVLERLSGGGARILRPVSESSYEIYHDVLADAILAWRATHEAQRKGEQERKEAWARSRRKLLGVAFVAVVCALLVAVVFALIAHAKANDATAQSREASQQRNAARLQAKIAGSRDVAASALAVAQSHSDPDLSLLLATKALRIQPTDEAADALRQALLNSNATRPLRGHTGIVGSAQFSRDGRSVVTSGDDDTVRVWDAASGREVSKLKVTGRLAGFLRATFSRDRRFVAVSGFQNTVQVWSIVRQRPVADLRVGFAPVSFVSFSPDGRRVALTDMAGFVGIFATQTGRPLFIRRPSARFVQGVEFSPDGRLLIETDAGGTTRAWRASSGRVAFKLRSDFLPVISADGRLMITGDARGAVVRRTRDRAAITTLRGRSLAGAAFSADGRLALTTDRNGTTRVWSLHERRRLAVLAGGPSFSHVAQFSHDGRLVLTTPARGPATVWLARIGEKLEVLRGGHGSVTDAAFAPDSRSALVASEDQTPRIWRLPTHPSTIELNGQRGGIATAVFSRDGRRALTTDKAGRTRLWDAFTGRRLSVTPAVRHSGHAALHPGSAFSPDGSHFVTWGSGDNDARVWNASDGRVTAVLRGHRKAIRSAVFSSDGRRVATAADDGTARVWDATTGTQVAAPARHHGVVESAAFSPDGTRLVTVGHDSTARISDAANGAAILDLKPARRFTLPDGAYVPHVSATYSPDGRKILVASPDGAVRLWDAVTGNALFVLRGSGRETLNNAAFSPDGRFVVAGSDDQTAHIWDARTGQSVNVLSGHQDQVSEATFSASGQEVVTAAEDGSARLWDAATGNTITVMRSPAYSVTAAALSPDGTRIMTGGYDSTVRIYTCEVCAPLKSLIAQAHKRIGRSLTVPERQRYLHQHGP